MRLHCKRKKILQSVSLSLLCRCIMMIKPFQLTVVSFHDIRKYMYKYFSFQLNNESTILSEPKSQSIYMSGQLADIMPSKWVQSKVLCVGLYGKVLGTLSNQHEVISEKLLSKEFHCGITDHK